MSHRDESCGLFIGTIKLLLVLMNSAPAELLHLLVHAALQPSLAGPAQQRVATAKKNAGNNAGVGYQFQKIQTIFRRKRRLARQDRAQRRLQVRAFRSSTVHSIRFYPFLAHRLSGSSSSWAAVALPGMPPTPMLGDGSTAMPS